MNVPVRVLNHKLLRVCRRFLSAQIECKKKPQWIKPEGYDTNIILYNPITKCKVPLISRNKNLLTWYMCGPTVYDSAHIGHAANYVKSDIIRRILSDHFGINVVMVMSITDVDDKIIKRANTAGRHFLDLTQYYQKEFFDDMTRLNVLKPHLCCKVTDYIPQIIEFISGIIDKGHAYVTETGSVYFHISKYGKYGKLLKPVSDSTDPTKESVSDFALWKAAKEGEPFWEAPWGNGRPGWHIECSTFASTAFGNCIDIHSGGTDLMFPHHENEEAQSCSYHNTNQWVNYWLHCGHLFLKGDVKMSKSLNNTISIQEYLTKYTGNHFRILCLLSPYRHEIEFSDDLMKNAASLLHKIQHFTSDCDNYVAGTFVDSNVDEVSLLRCLNETRHKVDTALSDDFNTARAMHPLLELISLGNTMLHSKSEIRGGRSITAVSAVSNYISDIFSKFGITKSVEIDYSQTEVIEEFVKFRKTVRSRALNQETKDQILLTACDEARKNLAVHGIILKDMKDATLWSIKKY